MCLPHAPRVIRESKEFKARNTTKEIKGKKKSVIQYGLVSEIAKDTEMRVVLEKIGTGKVEFVSVMPNNKRSRNKKRPRGRS